MISDYAILGFIIEILIVAGSNLQRQDYFTYFVCLGINTFWLSLLKYQQKKLQESIDRIEFLKLLAKEQKVKGRFEK